MADSITVPPFVVSLQDLCVYTVSNYLSPSNVWSIHKLVPYVHCPRIEYIVHSFICDNFMAISHTDQFLALDEKEIHWLLDNQDIKVSEAAMFDSLAQWYKHDERERENVFKTLLEKVHMSAIEGTVLSELIKKYQLVKVIPELHKYEKRLSQSENLDVLIHQENICNMSLPCIYYRCINMYTNQFPHLVNLYTCQPQHRVKYWLPFMSKYIDIELAKIGRDFIEPCYLITCGEKLYIFGSVDREEKISFCFDMPTREITHCSDPPEILPYGCLHVTCGVYVFIIGGSTYVQRSGHIELQTVYRYDTLKDEWRTMPSTIYGHALRWEDHRFSDIALCFKSRYLFIFGRYCEKFDLCTNTWTEVQCPGIYSDLTWSWGVLLSCGYVVGEEICLLATHRYLLCLTYNVIKGSWKEPICCNIEPDFTEHCFSKIIGISKVDLNNAHPCSYEKCSFKYKISEITCSEGLQQRKVVACNEKSFLCTKEFIAFGVSIFSRGVCRRIKS